jgi:outer membrane lipoprotein SlyB
MWLDGAPPEMTVMTRSGKIHSPRRVRFECPGVIMNKSFLIQATRLVVGVVSVAALAACAAPVTRVTRIYESPDAVIARSHVDYGTVRRIEVTDTQQQVTGGGALLGGLIGGVVGNQFGHGFGRAAVTALGAAGGVAVGNNVEQRQAQENSGTRYVVEVRLDDGRERRFDVPAISGLRVGGRVRIDGETLSAA